MASLRASEMAFHFHGPKHQCAYCGMPADTEDHTVPSWFVRQNYEVIMRVYLVKVASCLECNVLASDHVDRTFLARKRRIAKALRRRHRGALAAAYWAADEIEELGPALRAHVESGIRIAAQIRERLECLESGLVPAGVPEVLLEKIRTTTSTPLAADLVNE